MVWKIIILFDFEKWIYKKGCDKLDILRKIAYTTVSIIKRFERFCMGGVTTALYFFVKILCGKIIEYYMKHASHLWPAIFHKSTFLANLGLTNPYFGIISSLTVVKVKIVLNPFCTGRFSTYFDFTKCGIFNLPLLSFWIVFIFFWNELIISSESTYFM